VNLTPEQREAVARRDGPLFVRAGAGSGKTRVLVERFVRAVVDDAVGVDRILAITFTEKAAAELKGRLRRRFLDLGDRTSHAAPSWGAVSNRLTSLYLSAAKSGTAPLSPNDGTLASAVPTGRASYQDSYAYSPTAGASVPSGKEGPDAFAPYVPLDQSIDQPEGLTFTTPPLGQPLRLAGPSELRFWAVTEASDMAWVGRLIDVAPNGSQSIITQGWLRASFRHVDPTEMPPSPV